jgi:hypothetical protein
MTMPCVRFCISVMSLLSCVVLFSITVESFTVPLPTAASRRTSLFLLPDHGKQLVAASASAYHQHTKPVPPPTVYGGDDDPPDQTKSSTEGGTATRSFVSRLFSLPSALWHPTNEQHQQEMVFPLIGFRRFYLPELGEARWLPTTTSDHASCRLPPMPEYEEPVYGWYSPVCRVSGSTDMGDDDDAENDDDL